MKTPDELIKNLEQERKNLFSILINCIKEREQEIQTNYNIGVITYLERTKQLNIAYSSELKLIKNYKLEKYDLETL